MSILEAIILGIIQGITEWLPISSSGHLALTQNLMGLSVPLFFDVILHFGTLLVIVLVFWRQIVATLNSTEKMIRVVIAVLPIIIVGFAFRDLIAGIFHNTTIVALLLILNGFILLSIKFIKPKRQKINKKNALFIGLFQALAILPGISRSGSTISAALFKGIDREEAAAFSFIIAIIPILGATLLEASNVGPIPSLTPYIIGTIVSVIVGYSSLKLLLSLIKKNLFHHFSYYCFVVGIVMLIIN